jgi:HemY protein
MRFLFWFVLLTALALAFILVSRADHGYVLLVLPPWRVEMSVALLLGILLLSHVAFYLLLRLLRTTLRLPREVRSWRARRRHEQAEDALRRATAALLAEQPAHALKLSRQSLELDPLPLAALVGAQAALELGETAAARALLDRVESDQGELVAARQAIARAMERGAAAGAVEPATAAPAAQAEGAP